MLWFVGLVTALLTSFYMFRLWYMTFLGESRSPEAHPHESPWSMLVPAGHSGLAFHRRRLDRHRAFRWLSSRLPSARCTTAAGSAHLEFILSVVAVLVALEGWLIADKYYRRKPDRPAQLAAALPGGYKLLANKYYVDEIYGAIVVKPLLGISKYLLGWVVDTGLLGGTAWLLGGIAIFAGAILQRWQSGNLRSYAAWLAAGAAAVCCLFSFPGHTVWPASLHFIWNVAGH